MSVFVGGFILGCGVTTLAFLGRLGRWLWAAERRKLEAALGVTDAARAHLNAYGVQSGEGPKMRALRDTLARFDAEVNR